MVIHVEGRDSEAEAWLGHPIGLYETDRLCASEHQRPDTDLHYCSCGNEFGHRGKHECDKCETTWSTSQAIPVSQQVGLNRARLLTIPTRQRYSPWFRDEHLAELTRRDNMFVAADEVIARMQVAMKSGHTLELGWMTIEPDEPPEDATEDEFENHPGKPVQRYHYGVAVMDIIDAYPLGWAYIAHPEFPTVLAVSLDVITNVRVEL